MSARSPARRLALLCFFAATLSGCQMLSHQDEESGGLTELAPAGNSTAAVHQEAPPPPPEAHDDVVNNPATHEDTAPAPPAPPPAPSDMPGPPPHAVNTVAAATPAEPPVATPPQAHMRHSEPVPLGDSTVEATAEPVAAKPRRHHSVPVPLGDSTVEATPEPAAPTTDSTAAATPSQPEDAPAEQVVHFEFASDEISSDDSDVLARHVVYLQAHPKVKLRLEGYTDARGSEKYNKALSERRARAVRAFLIQAGVKSRQLLVESFGSDKPVAEGSDEDAWAKNRRVMLVYQGR